MLIQIRIVARNRILLQNSGNIIHALVLILLSRVDTQHGVHGGASSFAQLVLPKWKVIEIALNGLNLTRDLFR